MTIIHDNSSGALVRVGNHAQPFAEEGRIESGKNQSKTVTVGLPAAAKETDNRAMKVLKNFGSSLANFFTPQQRNPPQKYRSIPTEPESKQFAAAEKSALAASPILLSTKSNVENNLNFWNRLTESSQTRVLEDKLFLSPSLLEKLNVKGEDGLSFKEIFEMKPEEFQAKARHIFHLMNTMPLSYHGSIREIIENPTAQRLFLMRDKHEFLQAAVEASEDLESVRTSNRHPSDAYWAKKDRNKMIRMADAEFRSLLTSQLTPPS